ncbi:hypothetical protein ABH19_03270 [Leptospirillum sp. Group II 'CF-1']|nr:hypothetical protein ABH19_03270 [Leptospirillum sp. Group II 'CF-1']
MFLSRAKDARFRESGKEHGWFASLWTGENLGSGKSAACARSGTASCPADRIVPIDTIPHIFICVREKMGNQGECMPDSRSGNLFSPLLPICGEIRPPDPAGRGSFPSVAL